MRAIHALCLTVLVSVSRGSIMMESDKFGSDFLPSQQDYEDLLMSELYEKLAEETEGIKNKNENTGQDYFHQENNALTSQGSEHHDALPFYCPPPNPCPKGFTAEDGCQEDIADNEDEQKLWINGLMKEGYCNCDQEHMFSCMKKPEGDMGTILNNAVMDPIQMGDFDKLDALPIVAKKSPRFKRSIRYNEKRSQLKRNPFLQGPSLGVVAKKGAIFH